MEDNEQVREYELSKIQLRIEEILNSEEISEQRKSEIFDQAMSLLDEVQQGESNGRD